MPDTCGTGLRRGGAKTQGCQAVKGGGTAAAEQVPQHHHTGLLARELLEGLGDAIAFAAARGNANAVRLLLEQGAEIDQLSRAGQSALVYALSNGQPGTACLLIGRQARLPDPQRNAYLLPAVALAEDREGARVLVEYLASHGYSVDATMLGDTALHSFVAKTYEAGKIVAVVCHGTCILLKTRLSNGELLVKGKTVTGFANAEEDYADNAVWSYGLLPRGKHVMPWRIEDRLKAMGANYVQAGLWRGFAVRDGNLITGQQNFSGEETARLVVAALGE